MYNAALRLALNFTFNLSLLTQLTLFVSFCLICHISSLLPAIIVDNSCLLSPIGANLLEKKNFSWNFCLLLDS